MKTQDLTGPALDWAVEKIIGGDWRPYIKYSTDWSQGGPIIERERIGLSYDSDEWEAHKWINPDKHMPLISSGPTPLIAAMRCLVAYHLGDTVEVPDELKGESK